MAFPYRVICAQRTLRLTRRTAIFPFNIEKSSIAFALAVNLYGIVDTRFTISPHGTVLACIVEARDAVLGADATFGAGVVTLLTGLTVKPFVPVTVNNAVPLAMTWAVLTTWTSRLTCSEYGELRDLLSPVAQTPDHTTVEARALGATGGAVELSTKQVLIVKTVVDPSSYRSS